MDVEKIELLQTLKSGEEVWPKGRTFDKKDGPFPSSITAEIRAHLDNKSRGVIKILMTSADVKAEEARIRKFESDKVIAEQAQVALEKEKEDLQAKIGGLSAQILDLADANEVLEKENKALKSEVTLLRSELIDLRNEAKKAKK